MKTYWPLAAFFLILLAIFCMSQYADHTKREYENAHTHVKAAPIAKDQNDKASNDTDETYKPPIWAKYVTFPEGLGAWAVVLTLFAVVWQSIETRKSANASLVAAQAARISAESTVNIERPWIIVSADDYGHWRFEFKAFNRGKSPAEIIKISSGWKIVRAGDDLSEEPVYKMRNAMNPRMIFPGDEPYICGACNVGDILTSDIHEHKLPDVANGEGMFMMFGRVLYYDLLNRRDPPHETRFCFFWNVTDPQTVDERDTPSVYVSYT